MESFFQIKFIFKLISLLGGFHFLTNKFQRNVNHVDTYDLNVYAIFFEIFTNLNLSFFELMSSHPTLLFYCHNRLPY